MTPEAQRIAIAEACGWCKMPSPYQSDWQNWHGPKGQSNRHYPPDYLNDLNAMHEAENSLTEEQHDAFQQTLLEVMHPGTHWSDMANTRIVSATAARRAEAFLKTLNLWEP